MIMEIIINNDNNPNIHNVLTFECPRFVCVGHSAKHPSVLACSRTLYFLMPDMH